MVSDDIVTRLREAHQKVLPDWLCNDLRFRACYEIERLRVDLRFLLHHIEMLECSCFLCEEVIGIDKPYVKLLNKELRGE